MGADLYITKITNVTSKKWRKKLDESFKDKGEKKFDYYWNKMYPPNAYFRDAYNDSNLLWKFGVSYWQDINKLVDKRGLMSPVKAAGLLLELKDREAIFNRRLRDLQNHDGDPQVEYFEKKYKRFKKFLKNAIILNSNIRCSI